MTGRVRNPFTPTFGKVPPYLAGRDEVFSSMRDAFANGPGDPNLSTILIGARGTGKTALLSSIADEALEEGWVSADVSAVPGMLEDILQRAEEAASSFLHKSPKAQITGISVGGPFGVDVERPSRPVGNWRTQMNVILNQLAEYCAYMRHRRKADDRRNARPCRERNGRLSLHAAIGGILYLGSER
ncbi:MAG: ATP-binding protein [Atopobiaceae bacterium]|nr:ATP-binding protein [Atopobiaceae bacterium]